MSGMSINRKLMLALMLIGTVVLLLTSAGFITYELLNFRRGLVEKVTALAKVIAENSTAAVVYDDPKVAFETLYALRAEPEITAAAIYDKSGALFVHYPMSLSTNQLPAAPGRSVAVFGDGFVTYFEPIVQFSGREGTLFLKADLSRLYERFRLYAGIGAVMMAGSLLAAFLLANVLQRRIAFPILDLAATARLVSEQNDFSVRAKKLSDDEIGVLTDAFNHMLGQIQQRDEALRENAQRLRLAREASRIGIWDWNLINNRIDWDEYTPALFGLNPGDFNGTFQHFLHLLHPEDRGRVSKQINKALEQMSDAALEFRVLWPDGSVHSLASRGRGFYEEHGKAVRMSGVTLDITESKRAEQALRESEGLLRAVFETAVDGIITIDETGIVRSMNPAAERIFSYSAAEIVGQNIRVLMPSPYHEEHDSYLDNYRRTGEQKIIGTGREVHGLRKDGTIFPLELSVSETQLSDQRIFTGIVRDITERKRAEKEIYRLNAELEQRVLERTAELEAINRELEAFTYSVSHDLRAPLRHIDAYAKILEDEFQPQLPPTAERYVHRIRHGVQNMGRLVDDLLNLARVGRQELVFRHVPLGSLLHEVLEEIKPEIANRQIEWRIGELPEAACDPGLAKQVFANLISNAVKYSLPRTPAIIEVGSFDQDGNSVLFVRDNGVGFNMRYAHKLFGVFQRLHRAEEFEGTGVGLATVERIVRKHGGRIWVEAEVDKGATFYFTLAGPTTGGRTPNTNPS